jgi:hypothetical protein
MLDPNQRSLLTSVLTPPPGMVFDTGVATTFSLDPLTLLGVPLHLAWLSSHDDRDWLTDPIRLLEALRRVTDRLTVFADRGHMLIPGQANALFALLEGTISEVRAPRGGAFHSKLWLLRFRNSEDEESVVLRLGVLSRNLTFDRSWDLSLVLEGTPGRSNVAANRPLGELVAQLPSWAVREVSPARRDLVQRLAADLRRTRWELPGQWEELHFHVLGTKRGRWDLGAADDLAVISPFLTTDALAQLCAGKRRCMALVSRPDSLAALPAEYGASFERCLVLDDAAETEDGEASESRDTLGLHAKAVVLRRGWKTHLFVGSANATTAAMVAGRNIEVMVELVGGRAKVGRVEDLLGESGLGGVLADFDSSTPVDALDPATTAAEVALESCQRALAAADLAVYCTRNGDGHWGLALHANAAVDFDGVAALAWPLSLPLERGVDAAGLASGTAVDLGLFDAADVTGLTGFELSCAGQVRRFALHLSVHGLPSERDAAILRRIVRNREGFLRYLRLLLGDFGAGIGLLDPEGPGGKGSWRMGNGAIEALLEDMVRAWSREPERLRDVQRVVERLRGETDEDGAVVPPDFDALWTVFEQALQEAQ